MKQTAVEWLLSNISSKIDDEYWCNQKEITEFVDQAKEMEKQQQGYSEEEVKEFLHKIVFDILNKKEWFGTEEWFEQFKK